MGGLWGGECPSDLLVIVSSARGSYFVSTNSIRPFAKGQLGNKTDLLMQFWGFLFPPMMKEEVHLSYDDDSF